MSNGMPRTKIREVRRLTERRTKREVEENSWEARKASRVEKWSIVKVRNLTRGEPASEAIANHEVISSPCFRLPSLSYVTASAPALSSRSEMRRVARKYIRGMSVYRYPLVDDIEGLCGTATNFLD